MHGTIAAHVQHCKMHMSVMRGSPLAWQNTPMDKEKVKAAKEFAVTVVFDWSQRVLAALDWTSNHWATRASIDPTTVTRNI